MSSLRISSTVVAGKPSAGAGRRAAEADLVPALRLLGDEFERLACVAGEPCRRQALEPVAAVAAVQQSGELRRRCGRPKYLLDLANKPVAVRLGVVGHGTLLCCRPLERDFGAAAAN